MKPMFVNMVFVALVGLVVGCEAEGGDGDAVGGGSSPTLTGTVAGMGGYPFAPLEDRCECKLIEANMTSCTLDPRYFYDDPQSFVGKRSEVVVHGVPGLQEDTEADESGGGCCKNPPNEGSGTFIFYEAPSRPFYIIDWQEWDGVEPVDGLVAACNVKL